MIPPDKRSNLLISAWKAMEKTRWTLAVACARVGDEIARLPCGRKPYRKQLLRDGRQMFTNNGESRSMSPCGAEIQLEASIGNLVKLPVNLSTDKCAEVSLQASAVLAPPISQLLAEVRMHLLMQDGVE